MNGELVGGGVVVLALDGPAGTLPALINGERRSRVPYMVDGTLFSRVRYQTKA